MNSSANGVPGFSVAVVALLLLSTGCSTVSVPRFPGFRNAAQAAAEAESKAELSVAFAMSAERRGETDEAMDTYERIVESGQGSAEVHHRMALIHDRKGESAKAEHHYVESLKIDPNQAKVWCDFGYSLYLRESFQLAEEKYRKSIQIDPQHVPSRVNLGMLLARTDRFDEALHQFALGGLSEAESHQNVALAATENGDSQTAVRALHLSREAEKGRKSSVNRRALEQVVYRIANRPAN